MSKKIDTRLMAEVGDKMVEFARGDERLAVLLSYCLGRLMIRELKAAGKSTLMADERVPHIVDWLKAAITNDEPWLRNIDALGRPKKLMKFADLAHMQAEADKAMRINASKSANVIIKDGDERLVMTLDEGMHIVELLSAEALDIESSHMQHCIGNGAYDEQLTQGGSQFYSLRDNFGKPHATLQVDRGSGNRIVQLQGKQNEPPVSRYLDPLGKFIIAEKMNPMVVSAHIGKVLDSAGVWHDMTRLPVGLETHSGLMMRSVMVDRIPDGTRVNGDLNISNSGVRVFGKNLYVAGDFDASGIDLDEVSPEWVLKGGIYLSRNRLRTIPVMNVAGELDCSNNPLEIIPPGLSVDDALILENTKVSRVPPSVHVGGRIDLTKCPIRRLPLRHNVRGGWSLGESDLEIIPEGFTSYGFLMLAGCVNLRSLPDNLTVMGHLDFSGTPVSALPKRMKVGSLHLENTLVNDLPEDIVVTEMIFLGDKRLEHLPPGVHDDCMLIFNEGNNRRYQIAPIYREDLERRNRGAGGVSPAPRP